MANEKLYKSYSIFYHTGIAVTSFIALIYLGQFIHKIVPLWNDYMENSRVIATGTWTILSVLMLAFPMPSPFGCIFVFTLIYCMADVFHALNFIFFSLREIDQTLFVFFVLYPVAAVSFTFYGYHLFQMAAYTWYPRAKIQRKKAFLSWKEQLKVLKTTAFNLFCIVPLIGAGCWITHTFTPFSLSIRHSIDSALFFPSGAEIFLTFLFFIFINEWFFFYSHWCFHLFPYLYKTYHKIHHEYTAPIGIVSIYCHPLELVVSDFLPLGIGAFWLGCSVYSFMLWVPFAVIATMSHHSGYQFWWNLKFDHQPKFHDSHHEFFNCNYGNLGWLDSLHGTRREI